MSTARAVATLDCDFVALNITPSENTFVSPIKVPDYMQWLSGVEVVLQAHHLSPEQAVKIAGLLNVSHVEIQAGESFTTGDSTHLWAFKTKSEQSTAGAYAVVGNEIDLLEGNAFLKVKNAPATSNESLSYDIDVKGFENADGLDFDALESAINALKGK